MQRHAKCSPQHRAAARCPSPLASVRLAGLAQETGAASLESDLRLAHHPGDARAWRRLAVPRRHQQRARLRRALQELGEVQLGEIASGPLAPHLFPRRRELLAGPQSMLQHAT